MLSHKLWRTMWQYKAQFISMWMMITLGIGMFVGFNMEWYSIEKDTSYFREETGFADYRIVEENGFSEEDLEAVAGLEGVEAVSRYMAVNVDVAEQEGDTLSLSVTENEAVTGFMVKEGEAYDSESKDGIWLSEKYAKANGIEIGDTITLKYMVLKLNGTVQGLIQSSEYLICVRDETQLMPDYDTHGFAFISPAMLHDAIGMSYYPQIHVISDMSKEEFTEAVDQVLGTTPMIITKDEVISYAEAEGEATEGKTMASVLPVVFLLIAVLTMITTMHRLALRERIQIGTLKALGFKDRRILRHYTSYALMIGVLGIFCGILLGYPVAKMIMDENGMMGTYFDLPQWNLYIPAFCWIILVAILVLLTLIGYLSVKNLLRGTAADTLRNDIEEKQRALLIEKSKWFHKLSFGTRWNMRDIVRHKARTAMSLLGVIGCTVIIIAAFGMQDTMDAFLATYYNEATNYASRIYLSEDISEKQLSALTEEYGKNTSQSIAVQIFDKAVSLDIYDLEQEDLIRFPDDHGGFVELTEDGVYICERIADEFDVATGDTLTVKLYGSDEEYTMRVLGVSRSISESIISTRKYAEEAGITYSADSLYTETDKADIESQSGIESVQSKQMIMDSFDSFTEIMNTMIVLLVAAGVVLGIVVLYNLGTMSYAERYREMATLKVLGFKDKKIGSLLTSQNLWVSVAGIVIGLPLGVWVLYYLIKKLAAEYELTLVVDLKSYVICIVITLGMSLLVSRMVSRKNKKIDMVEALKSAE